jgi:hypothetical protein
MCSAPRMNFRTVCARLIPTMCLLLLPANAIAQVKICPTVEIQSIKISPERWLNASTHPPLVGIELSRQPVTGNAVDNLPESITIIANGPVLSSLDSRAAKSDLTCTDNGFALSVTIEHSTDSLGFMEQNVSWRLRAKLQVVLKQPEPVFETIWKLVSTSGAELDRARSFPFPEQTYPLTVTRTLTMNLR